MHNLSLDEIPTPNLERELYRRKKLLHYNLCPYCGRQIKEHNCKMSKKMDDYLGVLWETEMKT